MKRGACKGSHWVWEGTWSTYILWGSTSTSRTPCHRVQLLDLGPRWKLLLVQAWTQPTHRGCGVGGLLEKPPPVHRAAGCVCFDCFSYTQQLFIEKPLVEKKAKLNAPLFCTHIRWTSRSANGNVLSGFPVHSALMLSQIRGVSSKVDLRTREEIGV